MFGFIADIFGYLLNALYFLFNNYGIAIIIFSVILRLILMPITYSQQKALKKNGKIQKEIKELQNKYKNNQEKMNQEMMSVYKREGVSPFSGCLSGIIQIVIVLSVFYLVSQPLTHMKNVADTEIYKEYDNKVTDNGNTKVSYKEIAIINAVERDYKEIENKLNEGKYVEEDKKEEIKNNEEIEKVENNENQETENIANQNDDQKIESAENTEENENNQEEKNGENTENEEKVETREELENKKNEIEILRLNMNFLGIDLSKVPTQSLSDFRVYIIPVLYIISSFISTKMTTQVTDNQKENENKEEDPMQSMNKSMTFMMPIMSVTIAIIAPLGLALYWLISNILMIVERLIIKKIVDSKEESENA